VGWLVVDPQWRILETVGPPDQDSSSAEPTADTLAWVVPPEPSGGIADRVTGRAGLGGGPHAAIAVRLQGSAGYVVAHRPLASVGVAPATLSRSLLATFAIAWLWTSSVMVVVTYLILMKLRDRLAEKHRRNEVESLRNMQSLVRTRDAVILGLASLVESRDEITGRHVERVSYYSSRLAVAASRHPKFSDAVTEEFIRHIAISSMLHDIGKVGVEDWVLFKPGKLTEGERSRIKRHSLLGAACLERIEQLLGASPVIRMGKEIARWHHERWDGEGYPDGLAGEQIPLAARIVALADVYEALTSLRNYKPPFPHERCVEIIRSEAGKQFDPDLVEAFLTVEESFRQFACQSNEPALAGLGPTAPESDPTSALECSGLVAAMKVIDENWTVPTGTPC
jgi:HD-GYP domain-containing protein (c-di-GMP phosphodiesterase class II)